MKSLETQKNYWLYLLLLLIVNASNLNGQAKMRKLPNVLNHPSYNSYAPYLSADATAIVFITDNAEDDVLTPFYSFRNSADWSEPQLFPKTVYSRLNFVKGFALSADGKKLFYSTLKTPSVGGFDIWMSDWKGTTWGEPVNLGIPVNSAANDGGPSLSADGTTLFFMRCDKMDQAKAQGCKLFSVTKKPNGQWGEAVELSSLNSGNSQTPRIMADGETLIFSSDKIIPNKGGMDLYVSRLIKGTWSQPVALDFVNTDKDDQYISVAGLGRYLIRDVAGTRKNELVEYLIPDNLRPKGMMKIDGKVTDPTGGPIPAYISITDITRSKRVYSGRPNADGSFIVYIMEGSRYELAIDPEKDNATFFVKQFDLVSDRIPQVEKVNAVIKNLEPGDEVILDGVKFKPYSAELDREASNAQLQKLMRAIKGNPQLKFEIQVLMRGYQEDSVQSQADLTEVIYDSIRTTYDEIDTAGQVYQEDTVLLRTTFHNDRTWQQARIVAEWLTSQGVDQKNIGFFGNSIPAILPEEKKLIVKAVVKKN